MNTPIFTIKNGFFSYRETCVLQDINLQIEEGKFYGLIGPNGSGKTTLLDILMGTQHLQKGSNHFMGSSLDKYTHQELATLLSLVPQNFTMGFSYSVYDIVLMGRHPHIPRFSNPSEKDHKIVSEALDILDISHLKYRPVTNLSGGETQRVIVARALAQKTKVLILDEATSNLDIQHTIEIMRVIKKSVEDNNTTVIAAIHDLNLAAAFCDELIVLKERKVHTQGTVKQVLNANLISEVFSVTGSISLDEKTNTPRVNFDLC